MAHMHGHWRVEEQSSGSAVSDVYMVESPTFHVDI